jgi:hypothetical protein
MRELRHRYSACAIATTIALGAIALGGCGGVDGVELNGKIFEALGVAGDGAFGKKVEPKTQARAPLVLPPDPNRLPEPGSASQLQTGALQANPQWPQDRDSQRLADADAKKRAHEKWCREDGNWKERAVKDDIAAAQGPGGSCHGSLLSIITDQLSGNKQ